MQECLFRIAKKQATRMSQVQATISTENLKVIGPRVSRQVAVSAPPRNIAVDAYRGLVMLLMMGEILKFWAVARAYPNSLFWHVLAYNQTHVQWA
jgi:hypothetical protein